MEETEMTTIRILKKMVDTLGNGYFLVSITIDGKKYPVIRRADHLLKMVDKKVNFKIIHKGKG